MTTPSGTISFSDIRNVFDGVSGETSAFYFYAILQRQHGASISLSEMRNISNQAILTFTRANATGDQGPTANQILSQYGNTVTLWQSIRGYQLYTINVTGRYKFIARGARGGGYSTRTGGLGGEMVVRCSLQQGNALVVTIGQQGQTASTRSAGCGGGCSTVVLLDDASINSNPTYPLLVAGGGGGASTTQNGGNAADVVYGTDTGPTSAQGPSGGYYYKNGAAGTQANAGGGWITSRRSTGGGTLGGFGGGAETGTNSLGAGGGGYYGGDGGFLSPGYGRGGGNYTDTNNLAYINNDTPTTGTQSHGTVILYACV